MENKSKAPPLYICDPDRALCCLQMYCRYRGRGPCFCTARKTRAKTVDNRPDGKPVPCDNVASTRPVSRLSQPRAIAWWDDHAHAVEEDSGPFRDTEPDDGYRYVTYIDEDGLPTRVRTNVTDEDEKEDDGPYWPLPPEPDAAPEVAREDTPDTPPDDTRLPLDPWKGLLWNPPEDKP